MNDIRVRSYKNYKERSEIIRQEKSEGRKVRVENGCILSCPRKRKDVQNSKEFRCNICQVEFEVASASADVMWVVCPDCGSMDIRCDDERRV